MKRTLLATLFALSLAAPGYAQPGAYWWGDWHPVDTTPSEDGSTPYSNPSYDGPQRNAGYVLDGYGLLQGEYFHGAFVLPTFEGHEFHHETARSGGRIEVLPGGVLHYVDDPDPFTGRQSDFYSNSWGWDRFWVIRIQIEHALLFIVGVEDGDALSGPVDFDGNDRMFFYWYPYPSTEGQS